VSCVWQEDVATIITKREAQTMVDQVLMVSTERRNNSLDILGLEEFVTVGAQQSCSVCGFMASNQLVGLGAAPSNNLQGMVLPQVNNSIPRTRQSHQPSLTGTE